MNKLSLNSMSWNPTPTIGSASWSGNPPVVTKNQLLSTSAGLAVEIINSSTISVSTLIVPDWISTAALYVSDIQGANISISGITIDPAGIFNAPIVSLSSMNMKGFDSLLDVDVSFDFGLGKAIGGVVGGLGALVGGGLIAVGTGAGLAIQGAETGIATMIAGRGENFIDNRYYETINFTSQLQVSTLGDAFPAYSSIFRTVSSFSANQIPGLEIYTSTIFYPGQICIRSASDPLNLITGDPNVNSSTIQSFGQWVPLGGLEPEDIFANSISTNYISAGQIVAGLAGFETLVSPDATFKNANVLTLLSNAYNAPHFFDLGSSGDAYINGYINQWNFQTDQPIVFSQLGDPGSLTPGAILTLGTGAESVFQVSSIEMTGELKANTGYFSSLVVNELTVVSSFSTIYTIVACNVLSTSLISAYLVSTINLEAQYVSPFTISSVVGNPVGPFDFTKYDFIQSTSYNQVSSLTQNILNYTLVEEIQDQTSFNLNIAETPFGVNYSLTPQNVSQWGSSIMIFNDYQYGGVVVLPVAQTFVNSNLTGVFDVQTQYSPQVPGYYAQFEVQQTWIPGSEYSTFSTFLQLSGPNPPVSPPLGTWRFEIGTNGWIKSVTPNATPFETTNSNIFTITQDINDTTIAASDRLNLQAGEIVMKGTLNLTNTSVETAYAINSYTSNATVSTIQGNTGFFSTLTVDPYNGGFDSYHYKSSISYVLPPTSVTPMNLTFLNDSPDYLPINSLLPPFIGSNSFTSYNASSWNNTVWNNNIAATLGPPGIYVGDVRAPLGSYAAQFWINNTIVASPYSIPVYQITNAGSNLLGNVAGNTYAKIATTTGTSWTLTPNVPNPQGVTKSSYSNILSVTQSATGTDITDTQNIQIQAPNTIILTGTLSLNADQVRVNSRTYGSLESAGLPSYPIGIENTVYQDNSMSFTQYGVTGVWYSDATNIVYNITGNVFYDANSWIIQVIPSRFRFPATCAVYGWDVQPTIFAVTGGSGYCWGYTRYITVSPNPGTTGNNWNWILAIPKNYCTYL